jgi:hypothetical protein
MKKNQNLFISKTSQIEQDLTSSKIRDLQSKLKQIELHQEAYLIDLRDIIIDQNPSIYQQKLKNYQAQLKIATNSLAGYQKYDGSYLGYFLNISSSFQNEISQLKKKILTLEKLVATINIVIARNDARAFLEIFTLEQSLNCAKYDLCQVLFEAACIRNCKELSETIRELRKRSRYLLIRSYTGFYRDLRLHFRNLVHYLLGKMNDEPNDIHLLFNTNCKQRLITTLKFINHGFERGHRYIKILT